jgi:hypothetical protein
MSLLLFYVFVVRELIILSSDWCKLDKGRMYKYREKALLLTNYQYSVEPTVVFSCYRTACRLELEEESVSHTTRGNESITRYDGRAGGCIFIMVLGERFNGGISCLSGRVQTRRRESLHYFLLLPVFLLRLQQQTKGRENGGVSSPNKLCELPSERYPTTSSS